MGKPQSTWLDVAIGSTTVLTAPKRDFQMRKQHLDTFPVAG